MTAPLNLDALQALCDAATPAPWVKRPLNGRKYYGTHVESPEGGVIEIWRFGHRDETASAEELGEWGSDEPFEYCDSHYQTVTDAADADFIAAARSAVPALIQEVRLLEAKLFNADHDLERLRDDNAELRRKNLALYQSLAGFTGNA